MIAAMAARSPARFIAPLALLAFALALFLVVSRTSTDSGSSGSGAKTTKEQPVASPAADGGGDAASNTKGPRFYRVKAGDTPSAIAERTGVPLSRIMELNPDLDPQTLSPGQRIKLRTK
jgi:LysM repeat protein